MKQHKRNGLIGPAAVLLAGAMWGCIGIFTRKLTSMGFSSAQIVAVRAVSTTVLVGIYMLLRDRSLFRIRLRELWIFLGTGLVSFLFFNLCYMTSIVENSLSVACILLYTSPIWVTLLSAPLFHEPLTGRKITSLCVCFGGCVLVCCAGGLRLTGKGLLCGLLSGLGYAAYSLFGKPAAEKYSSVTILFYTFLFASLGVLPMCRVWEMPALLTQPGTIWYCGGITVVNTLLPYLFYTYGLGKIGAGNAAMLAIIEPVVASLVGVFAFRETIGFPGILGIVLVIGGLVLLESGRQKGKDSERSI